MSFHTPCTRHRRERGGVAACSAGVAQSVPTSFLLKVSSPPDAPVSRLPQRRDRVPFRCGLSRPTAQRVKTAQEGTRGGRGALVLVLTAVLDLDSRTGGTRGRTRVAWESRPALARSKDALREVVT
jgi:hypothetical protein